MAGNKKVWKHNSYLGYVAMAKKHLLTIAAASTVTPEAKRKTHDALVVLSDLAHLLKTRID